MFTNPSLINLKDIDKMPKHCPNCEEDFMPEAGYYFGAMFVSYGITCFLLFMMLGISLLLYGSISRTFLYGTIVIVLLLWTYLFRLSRVVWINIALYFDKNVFNF